MIPEKILQKVGNSIPNDILEKILEKLRSVYTNRHDKAACKEEKPALFVTPRATPHLEIMQSLGLVEKNPIHKPNCGCNFKDQPADAYRLTKEAREWYIADMRCSGSSRK